MVSSIVYVVIPVFLSVYIDAAAITHDTVLPETDNRGLCELMGDLKALRENQTRPIYHAIGKLTEAVTNDLPLESLNRTRHVLRRLARLNDFILQTRHQLVDLYVILCFGRTLEPAKIFGGHNGTSLVENDTRTHGTEEDTLTTLSIVLVGTFLMLLIFLSIAGNILVCVAIYTDRGLRRIGNLFLASLAIADLFVAALVMTFAVVNDLLGYWIFGEQFCDTWIAFDVMCSTASILNLCAISLDRYIHIKDPLRYSRWVTKRVALGSIGCIWLLAALVSFLPISLGLHRPPNPTFVEDTADASLHHPTCALDLTPTYAIVSSCISFYVPCIVMLGIYCRLYCYAQKHVKNIRAVTRPLTNTPPLAPHPPVHHASSPYHVSDHKAAITVGVIMGTFLLCWVPFFCINIVVSFCKTCIPGIYFKVLTWLGYSNSAFNPIIYSIFNTEFRDAFRRILTTHYPPYCCCKGYRSVGGGSGGGGGSYEARRAQRQSDGSIIHTGVGTDLVGVPGKHGNGKSISRSRDYSPRSSIASLRQNRINSNDTDCKVLGPAPLGAESEQTTSII